MTTLSSNRGEKEATSNQMSKESTGETDAELSQA